MTAMYRHKGRADPWRTHKPYRSTELYREARSFNRRKDWQYIVFWAVAIPAAIYGVVLWI